MHNPWQSVVRCAVLLVASLTTVESSAALPKSITVKVGEPLRISVGESGIEAAHYFWTHVIPAHNMPQLNVDSATLDLGLADMSMRGQYTVVVQNATGDRLEDSTIVNVYGAAPPAVVAAIDAPGLEWQVWNGDFQPTSAITFDGSDALTLFPDVYWFIQPALTTTVEGPGELSFKGIGEAFPSYTLAYFSMLDTAGTPIATQQIGGLREFGAAAEWQTYSFPVPPGPHELRWTAGSTDPRVMAPIAHIDQISYQPLDPENKRNFIKDGSFESDGSAWNNWGDTFVIADSTVDESHALQVRNQGRGQFVAGLQPGQSYRLQAYTRRDRSDVIGSVGVAMSNADYGLLENVGFQVKTSDYRADRVYFTVPEAATRAQVWLWKSAGAGSFHADKLSIVEVVNKVENPGFAQGFAFWNLRAGESWPATDDERGAVAEISENTSSWAWLDQNVNLVPGKRYKLSAWGAADGTLLVGVKGERLPRTELRFDKVNWQMQEVVIEVPVDETGSQVFVNGSHGRVDDIYLIEM